jgi:anti-sigma factor RsiW
MESDLGCKKYEDLVSDYADDRLKGRKRREVEAHVAACPSCSRLLADLRQLKRMVADLPVPPPSPGFWERCLEAASRFARPRPLLRRRSWVAALAGVLALFVIALLLFSLPPSRDDVASFWPAAGPGRVRPGEPSVAKCVLHHARFMNSLPLAVTSHRVLTSPEEQEDKEAEY